MSADAATKAPTPANANGDAAPAVEKNVKPAKPDEDAYKKALEQAEKEHKAVMVKFNAIKDKIELAQPNRNKEQASPAQKRRQELIAQLTEIRQKQAGFKNARATKFDQIKRLDEQLKSRIAEQKTARAKVSYKSVEDLDNQMAEKKRLVDSGTLKIVEEKKLLSEISAMTKQRKTFSTFDDGQKQIDQLKAKIKEIKDGAEDPEQKALSEKYNVLQKELDVIKAEADEAYKSLGALRDERSRLKAEQDATFSAIKKIKDDFYGQKRAFAAWEREAKEKARERQRAERERFNKERKKAEAERLLEEASDPAFLEEIRRASSLLKFLDPSAAPASDRAPLLAASGLAAQAQRTVEDSAPKGMKLARKEDRDDDYLAPVKKGKKGKKTRGEAASASSKFNCPPSVVQDCAFLNIDPPMSSADVPAVVEKVQAKLAEWKAGQTAQTQKNIEKAKKEIARLEAEEAAEATNGKSESPKEEPKEEAVKAE
ncbi:related to brefeldin A resistance protein BFR1 (maintenance of normal ploidy) [Cephalotrichum gorgonifer]|uniref:Related to brefeldin A resistance protein BFR1 (Maintenance of normal ploidy) n=1 Tax=Cephalotrichum gorgonifer TaxID=2041049 RepID=A0AAE8N6D6_9PEZI|nr:related to brefeldin A resistance protein BFR1 (maintenance of normal ploidy) [Cephalotrichum gorgonifer]